MRGIVLFTVAAVNKSGGECIMHSREIFTGGREYYAR